MHTKIEKLLYVSHFMIEFAMSRVLEKFWTRAAIYTRGIYTLPRTVRTSGAAAPGISGAGDSDAPAVATAVTRYWTIREGKNSPPFSDFGVIAGRENDRNSHKEEEKKGGGGGDNALQRDDSDIDIEKALALAAAANPSARESHTEAREDNTLENHIHFQADPPAQMSGNNVMLDTEIESAGTSVYTSLLPPDYHHLTSLPPSGITLTPTSLPFSSSCSNESCETVSECT